MCYSPQVRSYAGIDLYPAVRPPVEQPKPVNYRRKPGVWAWLVSKVS